jgi:hypothetical protein
MSSTEYGRFTVYDGNPTGEAGLAINNNFIAAEDAIAALEVITTKGDLIVGDGDGDPIRVGVGTNTHVLTADSTQASGVKWAAASGAGLSYWTEAQSGTVNSWSATGAGANYTAVVAPKGTGAFQTDTAGNARGTYAVDLQRDRALTTFVASGNYSVVGGGRSNQASSSYSTVSGGYLNQATGYASTVSGGYLNQATGSYSTVGGYLNQATGSYSTVSGGYYNEVNGSYGTVVGGSYNEANGNYSTAIGSHAKTNTDYQHTVASDQFSKKGDAQVSQFVLKAETNTTNSSTLINGNITFNSPIKLLRNHSYAVDVLIIARDFNNSGSIELQGVVSNEEGVGIIWAQQVTKTLGSSMGDPFLNVASVGGNIILEILIYPYSDRQTRWVGHARIVEVGADSGYYGYGYGDYGYGDY